MAETAIIELMARIIDEYREDMTTSEAIARLIIEAMREPPWRAMIDEALKEKPNGN